MARLTSPAKAGNTADPAAPGVRKVEVTRRAAIPDLSSIPEMLVSYLGSLGFRATLASSHSMVVTQHSVNQRYPFSLDDVDAETRAELKKDLLRHGFQLGSDGYVRRGDCFVYMQPEDARDEQLRQGLEHWMRQDDPASVDASLTEINELFRGTFGQMNPRTRVTTDERFGGDVSALSDHVVRMEGS